jgi:hypothetical protein
VLWSSGLRHHVVWYVWYANQTPFQSSATIALPLPLSQVRCLLPWKWRHYSPPSTLASTYESSLHGIIRPQYECSSPSNLIHEQHYSVWIHASHSRVRMKQSYCACQFCFWEILLYKVSRRVSEANGVEVRALQNSKLVIYTLLVLLFA